MLEQKEKFARLATLEMGKRIAESRGEVELSASILKYYADNAETFLAPRPLKSIAGEERTSTTGPKNSCLYAGCISRASRAGQNSGPIGIILDPTFDEHKYSELPFHSTLCGSCSEVCPVKIDISDQILKWRRVMAARGYLPLVKRLSFAVAGHVLSHPEEYHAVEKMTRPAMDHMPHFLLYNRALNPWGRDRELPEVAKQTFREWYPANRTQNNVDQ